MLRKTMSMMTVIALVGAFAIAGAGCGVQTDRADETLEGLSAEEINKAEKELFGFNWFKKWLEYLRDKYGTIVSVTIDANEPGGAYEGQFDTLIAALKAADPAVLRTLDGYKQYTVFAPTDDAFAKLGLDETTVGSLDKDFLTNVLLYHATKWRRYASSVLKSSKIKMLDGNYIFPAPDATITDGAGQKANIIVTNITAFNGVIHAIDNVLLAAPL